MLSPITAEFLLGDFTVRQLPLLLVFIPLYGGGALLIREISRRRGRGWPTIVLLALAYAIVEEGLITQSLFNPNYLGLRLLDYGYIPDFGISPVWMVFVLSIHVVWSIATPILIAEALAGRRRTTPWLGNVGLTIVAILFLLGCAATTAFTFQSNGFLASPRQLLAAAAAAVAAVLLAFMARRAVPGEASESSVPAPSIVAAATLLVASIFELLHHFGPKYGLPPAVSTLGMLVCLAGMLALIFAWSRSSRWQPSHYLAIAAGTVLTYSWIGLSKLMSGTTNLGAPTTRIDKAGQAVEVILILALIGAGLEASASSPRADT